MKTARERKAKILSLLKERGDMSIHALVKAFGVSALTIRRDLSDLASEGVQKYHGGGRWVAEEHSSLYDKRCLAIAKAAAGCIKSNDIVFVNSSSTAILALSYIKDTDLTVITNNGKALSMPIDPRIHLVLCGGDISFPKVALTGEFAVNNLNKVAANKCIIGVCGMSDEMGLTTKNLSEVAINHAMLNRTTLERIVVADSSKINKNSAFSSGDLSVVDTLITDSDADNRFIETLKRRGVNVIVVSD